MTKSCYAPVDYAVATRPLRGEEESGDLHFVIPRPRGAIVAVADGLGHGYQAAVAAKGAGKKLFCQNPFALPRILGGFYRGPLPTQGGAVGSACLLWGE